MLPEPITKLILVEDEAEDAEQVISILRNGGIALRPQRVTSEEELAAVLESSTPDLVLANPACKGVPFAGIARMLESTGKDIALMALTNRLNDDVVADIMIQGARGIALRNRSDQLYAVVRRELDALNMRRGVRRLEASLRESERRCDSLLDSSRDPIAYLHEGTHVRANRAYLEMFGFEEFEDVEGLTVLDLIASTHAADFKDMLKRMSRGEKPPPRLELTAQRADGSTFDAMMEFAPASYEGEPCLQVVFRRQEVDSELAAQLDRLKTLDQLTGLSNRAHFITLIDEAVAATVNGARDHALLLLEPDNYRSVNETVGITGADDVLRALAGIISHHLRPSDSAGRTGDHSFAVLLAECRHDEVLKLAEALRAGVEASIIEAGGHSTSLTVSVGGSLLGEKNANTQTLLAQASHALRTAASQGGNRVDVHDPAASEKAEAARERQWLELIDKALRDDNFLLYYQPLVSLQRDEGEFYEVLLRLNGPSGEVMPNFFFPVAETHARLVAIDRWVIKNAIAALRDRHGSAAQTTLFVKLSADTLQDETTVDWVAERLAAADVPAERLVLEAPESKVVTCLKPARDFVERWRRAGGRFALEQFGSGLNSFQLLKHIEADYLKLDRNLTADLARHAENELKVRELCSQARAAGKTTVVEWVEEAASMPILFSAGVGFAQGNFLRAPEREMAYVA